MKIPQLLAFAIILSACNRSNDANENLSQEDYKIVLKKIAPYVIKKSDEFSYEERFDQKNQPFYENFLKVTNAELTFYKEKDTANFFFFNHRDLTSLYEHYRGLGGYFKTDEGGKIVFMNLLYHTPRFTKAEMKEKGSILFVEMITKGNVNSHIGNRQFIHTPNDDFYYNTKLNRWDYTENSSWKFLEEAKQAAERN